MKPVLTPCKKVCAVDGQTSLCLGCGRTLQEIGGWSGFSDEERRRIMAELDERMERLKALGKLGPVA
ncbi:DUF1289 domain-containing protein [Henriciella aquimarina]|uniref:DUF1289 domain-containing protein n=1 Tax=Henriciella aquimarina TaxID=545261 RepID=UPI001F34FF86|nr:DUF1289 domain-containing protein [Henriciella aquimarina]